MSSDSDSSLELHDIDWKEETFFDYNDPLILSPQFAAVVENNVERLKSLFSAGKSVNINDNLGNTPLHVAVIKNRREAFDYLISVDDIRIDAVNFGGFTALMEAVNRSEEYYVNELIRKGANKNLRTYAGHTLLHLAQNSTIGQILINNGAFINASNSEMETALHVACNNGNYDLIYMLLFYGADATIRNKDNLLPFSLSFSSCPIEIQEILYDYTFASVQDEITLATLVFAMKEESTLFNQLMRHYNVVYGDDDLRFLASELCHIKLEFLHAFMKKFDFILTDLFRVVNPVRHLLHNYNESFLNFFYLLCDNNFIDYIIAGQELGESLTFLIKQNLSEATLTEILCCLLSYGGNITTDHLYAVYESYDFGELFKLLLHMNIVDSFSKNYLGKYLMPRLIYDCHLSINILSEITPEQITHKCFTKLRRFFVHPRLKQCFKYLFKENVPDMPSLLELSRNQSRKYLIEKYNIQNNVQFFTLLRWFPIAPTYKALLSFETAIYK